MNLYLYVFACGELRVFYGDPSEVDFLAVSAGELTIVICYKGEFCNVVENVVWEDIK